MLPAWVSVAAGFPTTIHPPFVWVAVPSLPVTVKWQNPGVLPGLTLIVAGSDGVIVALASPKVPLQAGAPSYSSNTAEVRVTFAAPLLITGVKVPIPFAGIIKSSGFRYHSDAGVAPSLPFTTSSVMLYGAKLCDAFHAAELDAAMDVAAVDDKVYAI